MDTPPPHGFAYPIVLVVRNGVLFCQFVLVLNSSKSAALCESTAIMSRGLSGWNYKNRKAAGGCARPETGRMFIFLAWLSD
jgi:hypothetical protein